jgi:nicotinate-nucleotide adenylyltransferase
VTGLSLPRPLSGANWAGRRVGLLGGSFNPAHDGHRHISLFALRALRLHQVWWLVSPQNPLKSPHDMATFSARLASARQASGHPRLLVTDLEAQFGTRYTADTLRQLRRRYPRTRFVWLMGADNLLQLPRWRHWRRIFECMPVAAFNRPPYSLKAPTGHAARRFARCRVEAAKAGRLADRTPPAWIFLRNPLHPASATAIRSGQNGGKTGSWTNPGGNAAVIAESKR